MESKKKNYFLKYMRIIMTALLASFLFYSGMKDYVKVGKTDIAVVELYEQLRHNSFSFDIHYNTTGKNFKYKNGFFI